VIPLNVAEQHFGRPADERAFLAVPFVGAGTAQGGSIEDDGETEAWRNGEQGRWNVTLTGDDNTLRVTLERPQWMPHAQPQVRVFVPMHETRAVICTNGTLAADHTADGWRCLTISLPH
jgi:alpha-glucosidase